MKLRRTKSNFGSDALFEKKPACNAAHRALKNRQEILRD
jgi:hypothetical protein